MAKESDTNSAVYNFVCTNPGLSTYAISKKLNMSGGKVRHALSRLQQMSLVEFKFERQSPHIRKLTYPVIAFKLLPKSMKRELKRMV